MPDQPISFMDENQSLEELNKLFKQKQQQLQLMKQDTPAQTRAELQREIADLMLELKQPGMIEASWGLAKEALLLNCDAHHWQGAVLACDTLYRSELPGAVTALAHGIWLAVSFPVDPDVSVMMLNNLIEDTPANSDGAAVAAITAHYIADMRLEGDARDSLMFLTQNIIAKVALRHSQVQDQQALDQWMLKLDLKQPETFLPKLAMVLEAMTENKWWYDRDLLRQQIPH